MNWDAVGAVGQMLGHCGVHHAGVSGRAGASCENRVTRSVVHARLEMVRQQFITLATDAGLDDIYAKANIAVGMPPPPFLADLIKRLGLTREEVNRLIAMEAAWVQVRTESIRNLDLLSEPDRAQFDAITRSTYRDGTAPGLFYQAMKSTFNSDFTRYVDNLLAQPG